MNHNFLLRVFHVANHLMALLGVYILYTTTAYNYLWYTLAVFVCAKIIGVNVGLHRFYSHRSFKTSKFFEYVIAFWSVIATVGSPIVYPGIHRQHHKFSDKAGDPHSPATGKFKSFIGMWNTTDIKWLTITKDLLRQPYLRFIHTYYFQLLIAYMLILLAADPNLVMFAYAIPACLCFWASSSVNVFAHTWGYRTFDTNDHSTNNVISSIMSLGEGWHNNHHQAPASWNTKIKWWELDPPAIVIKLIKHD